MAISQSAAACLEMRPKSLESKYADFNLEMDRAPNI